MDPRCPTPAVMSSQGYSPPGSAPPAPSPLQSQALTAADYGNIDLISSYEAAGKPSQASTTNRQPLQESTGNAQYQHQSQHQSSHHHHQQQQQQAHVPSSHYSTGGQYSLPSLPSLPSSTRACAAPLHQFGGPLIPPPPTVPTPPSILQSNAASQNHTHNHAATAPGGTSYVGLTGLRYRRYHDDYQRRKRDQNPLYACPEFAQYRLKQKDKDRQVWTDDLELFFQDGEFAKYNTLTMTSLIHIAPLSSL